MKRGFYSLLQYAPDTDRDERINIAVMLESPQCDYMGVRYLRYMESKLRCFDPSVDASLVRLIAKQLEDELHVVEKEANYFESSTPLFEDVTKPWRILDLKKFFDTATRTLWRVTEPKPVLLPQEQQFRQRLLYLYAKLVERDNPSKPQTYDKQYVRISATKAMADRHVLLEDGYPIKGSRYRDNLFDATKQSVKEMLVETIIQYMSFDVGSYRESSDQLKLFLTMVQDIRSARQQLEPIMKRHYVTVLQPPKVHRDIQHVSIFEDALRNLSSLGIKAFEVDNNIHYDAMAEVLEEGANPWEVIGLND